MRSGAAVNIIGSPAAPVERLTVGHRVVLSDVFADQADASAGPLKPGDIGEVIEDDKCVEEKFEQLH